MSETRGGYNAWLYFIALCMLANTISLIYQVYIDYSLLSYEALTRDFITQGIVPKANPYELFFNIRGALSILFILGSIYVMHLFVEKSASFPRLFAWLYVALLAAVIADDLTAYTIIDGMSFSNSIYLERDLPILLIVLIFVPYVTSSKQSKLTFAYR